jgi:putative hydrolase of the HAD superfamily
MMRRVVVFDLDDTLYQEIDYVESAFKEIAERIGHLDLCHQMMDWFKAGRNVFVELNGYLGVDTPIQDYLEIYRLHKPSINLSQEVKTVLEILKTNNCVLGIITDGRRISQMNKIESLNLLEYFDISNIVISEVFGSEKPSMLNYLFFEQKYPGSDYFYVGDNPDKDFYAPNCLEWHTIMLKDHGNNIHKMSEKEGLYTAHYLIQDISELLGIVFKHGSE